MFYNPRRVDRPCSARSSSASAPSARRSAPPAPPRPSIRRSRRPRSGPLRHQRRHQRRHDRPSKASSRRISRRAGSYPFKVKNAGGGGSANISQGGDFAIGAGEQATLGQVMLGSNGAVYDARLTVTVDGETIECAERVGGAI